MEEREKYNYVKEVQKTSREVQKKSLDFYVYEKIKNGYSPSQIVEKSNLSKQKVDYYISKLKRLDLIKKISYGVWEAKKELNQKQLKEVQKIKKSKLFSIGATNTNETHLHALQIKIPILKGTINDKNWEIKERLNNWIPKYTTLKELGGLEIKNNNNKSITVWAKPRFIKNVDDIHKLTHAILLYLGSYFKVKDNVDLDTINAEVKNLDTATEDKNAESMRGNGEKFKLNLNKKCEKILPKDNRDGKAWIDGSPFKFSAETNDTDWKREYLNMPFNIKHLLYSLPALDEYNKNLKLHIKVQEEQLKTQKEIQQLLKKLKSSSKGF